jgi:hypothetical protein
VAHGAPPEQQVGQLVERGAPARDDLELAVVHHRGVDGLDEQAAADAVEVEVRDAVVRQALGRCQRDGEHAEVLLRREHPARRLAVARRHDGLVGIAGDRLGGRVVERPVHRDHGTERVDRVALERLLVRDGQRIVAGEADRVRLLHDRARRAREVAHDAVRGVEVEQVVEGGCGTLQLHRVGERAGPVGGLAIEGRLLVRVLAVAQVTQLVHHDRELAREADAADVVEVTGDLGVVGRDRGERFGGEPLAGLRGDRTERLELREDLLVLRGVGCRSDAGEVAGGGGQQGHAADVDHLDRLVDRNHGGPDLRCERLHVHDHEVDGGKTVRGELLRAPRDGDGARGSRRTPRGGTS